MVRWEGGTEGRLARAAYELYLERGFDDVTIAEISERAGLTRRTFFRYFADKREVLFLGAAAFQESVVRAVLDAPGDVTAVDAVVAALSAGGTALTTMGDRARQRQRLIDTSTDLQEREMIKMAGLTVAIGDALQRRGTPPLAARLTAQVGVAVFTTAFERWAAEEGPVEFPLLVDEALVALRAAMEPGVGNPTAGASPGATAGGT